MNPANKNYKFSRPLESFQLIANELHAEHSRLLKLEEQLLETQTRITSLENYVCQAKKHWLEKKAGDGKNG